MARRLFTTRWFGLGIGVLVLALTALSASAGTPKRVLILDPFGRDVAPFSTVVSTFRSALMREMAEPVEFYEVPLDLARSAGSQEEIPLVDYLDGRIKSRPVDLVVSVGGASMQFVSRHRERLFRDAPILVLGADPRMVPSEFLRSNASLVTQEADIRGMVEDILQMRPQTRNIAVVFGASALENYWLGECRREFAPLSDRIAFTYLNDLPLDQMLQRCATLPPDSFILHVFYLVDANGLPCEKNEAIERLHEVANAPLFGYFASELGLGTIGGRLYQEPEIGRHGARVAARILRGEKPQNIPPEIIKGTVGIYDWRELKRWGISESRLPAGSIIQFREVGAWERYKWPITGGGLFLLLQAGLIIGLLINRAERRQGEAAAALIADLSSRFVNLPANELDREIVDAQRRVGELLGLDVVVIWQWSSAAEGVLTPTHQYSARELPRHLEARTQEHFIWYQQQMLAGRIVAFSSPEELPAEAVFERESCRKFGIKSSLSFPLSVGGEPPIGALGFSTTRAHRGWPESLVKRLQVVAQVFANALARRRADQALRESEERFRLLIEQAPDAIVVLDLEHNRIVQANAQAERLFGCCRGELLASDVYRFFVAEPPDGQSFAQSMRAHNARAMHGETVVFERPIRTTAGQRLDCEVRLVRLPAGERKLVRASFRDITEARESQAVLRASEELSRSTFEQAAVGIAHIGIDGRWLKVNDRLCDIVGYRRDEMTKLSFQDITYPEDLPADMDRVRRILSGEIHTFSMENRYIRKGGSLVWVRLTVSLVRDGDGAPMHFIAVVEDTTAGKQAEAEIGRQRAELAHLSRVTMLGELSGSLAHELNQPLTAILSNAQAAQRFLNRDQPDLDQVREILGDIAAEDKRAGEIIRRLRLLLTKGEVQRQPLDVNSVVLEVLTLLRSDMVHRGISVRTRLVPDLPVVHGDRVQLQQVLLNLVMNACDAMAGTAGYDRLLTIETGLSEDDSVCISVADSGTGLSPQALERVFEPFYSTKAKGMGLGLAVCRTIVSSHGGKLWAANNAGRGATFHCALPVHGTRVESKARGL